MLQSESGRLQSLIHRYINQPGPDIFAEILLLREAVLGTLGLRGKDDPMLSSSVNELGAATERLFDGFADLRAEQSAISQTYDAEVIAPANAIAKLYTVLEGSDENARISSQVRQFRESFIAAFTAANALYEPAGAARANDADQALARMQAAIQQASELAVDAAQRAILKDLGEQIYVLRQGVRRLSGHVKRRAEILSTTIDENQAKMITTIEGLSSEMRTREQKAQTRFDRALANIYRVIAFVAVTFVLAILFISAVIGSSILVPLRQLRTSMRAIVAEQYDRTIPGAGARDEIGDMARSVVVFRENAIAKKRAENDLRAAKERAEKALTDLRSAQRSLIEAEKLAALGGLVAGVAHEVNNPVGISLTVASSLARRCELFAKEILDGAVRRSKFEEFIALNRESAQLLVTNLLRAGELIQSFKQVAVDRSVADRREFDLCEATSQIVASLRPVLKKAPITLSVDCAKGVQMNSYPGSYGQVITNLFLNSVTHAFPEGRAGRVVIEARALDQSNVEVTVADDGIGMTEEVRKQAFDPFFTTRRSEGGTGLGLHIIHTLVTQRLGGRLILDSKPEGGTIFRLVLPRQAPIESGAAPLSGA
ncbi:MAG TPA: HAMP domain-containing sensor histidine kinase [Verrucomicrobiae bacterium]|nr:HAMP domain-containing sensor histidine kinase [Verrucomicrobiae bacterium]